MGKRVTFYLPDDLYTFLEGLRRTEHGLLTRSEVLKRVLYDYMRDLEKPRFYRTSGRKESGRLRLFRKGGA